MNQKSAEDLAALAVALIVGFGIALYIGSTFYTALPANSIAATATNAIIYGFYTGITTVLVPAIAIVFILWLYRYIKGSGLLGSSGAKN